MSISEKIAAAKAQQEKTPSHKDLVLSLDSSLVEERNRLLSERESLKGEREARISIAAGTLALAPDTDGVDKKIAAVDRKLAKVDEADRESLVTFRLYRAPGDEWFDMKATHPVRVNSAIDRGVGYNTSTLTKEAAQRFAFVADGDTETQPTEDEWADMWPLLAGGEFEQLVDAVYVLNVADSRERVERLKNS